MKTTKTVNVKKAALATDVKKTAKKGKEFFLEMTFHSESGNLTKKRKLQTNDEAGIKTASRELEMDSRFSPLIMSDDHSTGLYYSAVTHVTTNVKQLREFFQKVKKTKK